MATKKDLVEAYSFSRRRLVTAFVSGAPGGREVEPARPGRSIIGGVALTVLLVAGGAIAGIFTDQPNSDWKDPGLVRSEADGQNYIIFEKATTPELRPVINFASAQLILGPETEEVDTVSESEFKDARRGPPIGILGAPSPVPRTDDLIQSGWSACTEDDAGIRVNLDRSPGVEPEPSGAVVVSSEGTSYLIAEAQERGEGNALGPRRAYSYRIGSSFNSILQGLGLPSTEPKEVPASWLNLIPAGGDLSASSVPIEDAGKPYEGEGADDLPPEAKIGDYYETGGLTLVLTKRGAAQLSEFALIVYTETASEKQAPTRLAVTSPPDIPFVDPPYQAARWPEGDLGLTPVSGNYCVLLEPSTDEVPVVLLASNPTGDAAVPEDLDPGLRDRVVESGFGAFVLSGGFDNAGQGEPQLIDDRGFSYAVVGQSAVDNLGFGDVEAPVVPDSWLKLFEPGASLSVDAALCPPARDPQATTCDQ